MNNMNDISIDTKNINKIIKSNNINKVEINPKTENENEENLSREYSIALPLELKDNNNDNVIKQTIVAPNKSGKISNFI